MDSVSKNEGEGRRMKEVGTKRVGRARGGGETETTRKKQQETANNEASTV